MNELATVAHGEPNGRPLPKPYTWRPNEQARLEADAAYLADVRRRVAERFEAERQYKESVPGPAPDADDPEDLPAGAGTDPPVTRAPCAADAFTVKGDSQPAGVSAPGVWGAGSDAEQHAPEVRSQAAATAAPPARCHRCDYLTGSRGHKITCGGD